MADLKCPNGHPNRPGAKFCAVCRTQLVPASPQQPQGPQHPPQSPQQPMGQGHASPAQQFIPPASPQPAAMGQQAQSSRSQWILWGLIGVIVLAIIALSALLFWPRDEEDELVPTPVTAAEVTEDEDAAPEAESPTPVPEEEESPVPPDEEAVPPEVIEIPPIDDNRLINGNFRDNWGVGWERTIGAASTGAGRIENIETDRSVDGHAVTLSRTGPGFLKLEQTVPVDPARMRFSARIQINGSVGDNPSQEGIGALMLIYHNEEQTPIGYTIWASGPTRSSSLFGVNPLPPIQNNVSLRWVNEEWRHIDNLDLRQEIINGLPIVNPDEVRFITVMLLGVGHSDCLPDGCTVEVVATDLRLLEE
jgi:hypothetical protein